jgi:ketosteroid isomerase-like protein
MGSPSAPARVAESPQLQTIKEAFRAFVDDGFEAGIEALLRVAHADCEFHPYIASGRTLRGREEIRRYYREAIASGTHMRLRPTGFRETGDEVVVDGTIRVARPAGGFSESQIAWRYRFRDGRIAEAAWSRRRSI